MCGFSHISGIGVAAVGADLGVVVLTEGSDRGEGTCSSGVTA